MTQPIHGTSNLRLQVEGDPVGLPNIFPDPNGSLGTWALNAYADAKYLDITSDGTKFTMTVVAGATSSLVTYTMSLPLAVTAGDYYRIRYNVTSITAGNTLRPTYQWVAADGTTAVASNPATVSGANGGVGVTYAGAVQAPAGAAYLWVIWVQYVGATTTGVTAVGATASMNTVMVTHAATSAAVAGTFAHVDVNWVDILGPTHDITVDRQALDVGTLAATILDSTLDPATSTALTPGRQVRLQALVSAVWEDIFTGTLDDADAVYSRDERTGGYRTSITIEATDNIAELANTPQASGYGLLSQLPWIMEFFATVPWRINGNGNHVRNPSALTAVSTRAEATLLDQIATTRDSVSGYAWVDRHNVLVAYDAGLMPAGSQCTFTDVPNAGAGFDSYSDIAAGWNTKEIINQVPVTWLHKVAGAESTEVDYGPYQDWASVAKYGAHAQPFTIHGATESSAAIANFAAAIIAANKTPVRKASGLTLPVKDTRSLGHATKLDLYDKVTVVLTGLISAAYRITSIKHTIATDKWATEYGFSIDGAVAVPR